MRRINAAIQDAPDDDTHRLLARARALGVAAYSRRALSMPLLAEGELL